VSRIRLYLDEDAMHGAVVRALRSHGVDTVTLAKSMNITHYGIILAPQKRYSVGEQVHRLVRLINTKSAEGMRDSVEFLAGWSDP
jgi:hypothetical protein